MNAIERLLEKDGTITHRDLYVLLPDFNRKRAWALFKRLQKYNVVRLRGCKKIFYWEIVDRSDFLRELEKTTY